MWRILVSWELLCKTLSSLVRSKLICGGILQVVSEDGKKVRRVQPLPDVDLEEVQVWLGVNGETCPPFM